MKYVVVFIVLFVLFSCIHEEIIEINPETFSSNKVDLSNIAVDIKYVPLDSSYLIDRIYNVIVKEKRIYVSTQANGLLVFDINGSFLNKIGKIGLGPEEYQSSQFFTLNSTNHIYLLDKEKGIMIYSTNGSFIRNISLKNYNTTFADINVINDYIFLGEYVTMGNAMYNWIIIDSTGNLVQIKKNPIEEFESREGGSGGIYKYNDNINYWNQYNDTIFKITKDLKIDANYKFAKGNFRLPFHSIEFTYDYFVPYSLLETDNFLIMLYFYKKEAKIVLFDKKDFSTNIANFQTDYSGGILNSFDGGLGFIPFDYFKNNDQEYLVGWKFPYQFKKHVASASFQNSAPKNPEKKKELEQLANSLNENDNPVLILVKLKK